MSEALVSWIVCIGGFTLFFGGLIWISHRFPMLAWFIIGFLRGLR